MGGEGRGGEGMGWDGMGWDGMGGVVWGGGGGLGRIWGTLSKNEGNFTDLYSKIIHILFVIVTYG